MELLITSVDTEQAGNGLSYPISEMLLSTFDDSVHITVLNDNCEDKKFKQLDFTITKDNWGTLKMFIDKQLQDSENSNVTLQIQDNQ